MKTKMVVGLGYGVIYAAHEDEALLLVPKEIKVTAPDQLFEWSFCENDVNLGVEAINK